MALISRFGATLGVATAVSLASAAPAMAAELPASSIAPVQTATTSLFTDFQSSRYDPLAETAEGWRRGRWGRRGWRRGRRVRGGDILAGVLVLGGIAAIASAANNNNRRDRRVERYERPRDDRRDTRRITRNDGAQGLNSAVDQCVSEIQRDVRVDSVDSVDRTAQGWMVRGALFNGTGFSCSIGNDGRIDTIDYGSFGSAVGSSAPQGGARAGAQYDDRTYMAMRQARGGAAPYASSDDYRTGESPAQPLVATPSDRLPAYPGGPVPGEEYPE